MQLQDIHVKNFRLLRDVDLHLDGKTTVIVGRNNSGKTSLTELFRRLCGDQLPTFALQDFSLAVHDQFWQALALRQAGKEEEEIRKALPFIEARLTIGYDTSKPLGLLSEFIVDLNPTCTTALAVVRYEVDDGKIGALLDQTDTTEETDQERRRADFFKAIQERVPKLYKARLYAEDPNDATNVKPVEWSRIAVLMRSEFINAQRGLDDTTHRDNDVLGNILTTLFATACLTSANPADQSTAEKLQEAIRHIQDDLGEKFNKQLNALLPAFASFGYPSLPDPDLRTETIFDVDRLLTKHTKIRYPGANGIQLPEGYNGLGVRNLIFILLKLHAFFRAYQASQPAPGLHVVFIEEPEVHLHPQVQEVFIGKLESIAQQFATAYNNGEPWPVQFVVTTHSSHVANRAPFKSTRYFLSQAQPTAAPAFHSTTIKDLSKGLGGDLKKDEPFLRQYMTLTRCDLLFADKAILIEGTSERLLLPKMIEKLDKGKPPDQQLSSQYVSIVEVGGAYAHLFFGLLNFLELPTLVITDLDSTKEQGKKGSYAACKVSEGTRTSNACLNTWFSEPHVDPRVIIGRPECDKVKGALRVAFQIPEADGRPCGRSFEQAFILTNPRLFGFTDSLPTEDESWDLASAEKDTKSAFALKYAIESTDWAVPRYIEQGLGWLAQPAPRVAAAATATKTPAARPTSPPAAVTVQVG